MHALTTERKSTPATILAHVGSVRGKQKAEVRKQKEKGIEPLSHRAIEPLNEKESLNRSITQSPNHSIGSPTGDGRFSSIQNHKSQITNPRCVVTLDAPHVAGDALTRIPLAVTGKWVRDGSDFSITLGDLVEIVQNFNKRRNGEINVDYDHASEMPEVAAGGPVPSAGRIVKLDAPEKIDSLNHLSIDPLKKGRPSNGAMNQSTNGSILWGWYEPTPRARQLIESREYRYISPAINWAGCDKRTGKIDGTTLTSVALTNRPFLEELPQIRLSDPAFQLVDVGDVHVETSLGNPEAKDGIRDSGLGVAQKNNSAPHLRNPNPKPQTPL